MQHVTPRMHVGRHQFAAGALRAVAFALTLLAIAGTGSAGPTLASGQVRGVENGAQYALFMPAIWNGRLALYAHGFIDPETPIALPDIAPEDVAPWVVELRETLLGLGYGVAYSSYSENGWAVGDGARRTHELRGLFATYFAKPDRTYLVGRSLGSLITLKLVERHPGAYAGALALCGPVGGGLLETNYIANVRVLFDFFFPGVIPGDFLHVPPMDYSSDSRQVQAIVGAILANPAAAVALASVDQVEIPWTGDFADGTLINSIVRALGYNVRGVNDLLDRIGGLSPFDNTQTWYTGLEAFDAVLNAGVGRFAGDQAAFDYLRHFYQPTGKLVRPVLTLHTTLDPDVPFVHEEALANIVAAARRSKWLAQQHYDRYGHCNFSPAEAASAFSRLVDWAESGAKPGSAVSGSQHAGHWDEHAGHWDE